MLRQVQANFKRGGEKHPHAGGSSFSQRCRGNSGIAVFCKVSHLTLPPGFDCHFVFYSNNVIDCVLLFFWSIFSGTRHSCAYISSHGELVATATGAPLLTVAQKSSEKQTSLTVLQITQLHRVALQPTARDSRSRSSRSRSSRSSSSSRTFDR